MDDYITPANFTYIRWNDAELELVFVKASFPYQLCHVTFLRSKIGLIVFRSISYINRASLVEFREDRKEVGLFIFQSLVFMLGNDTIASTPHKTTRCKLQECHQHFSCSLMSPWHIYVGSTFAAWKSHGTFIYYICSRTIYFKKPYLVTLLMWMNPSETRSLKIVKIRDSVENFSRKQVMQPWLCYRKLHESMRRSTLKCSPWEVLSE